MFYIKAKKVFAYGLPSLLAIFSINHLHDYRRQQALKREKAREARVVVRVDDSTLGHTSIGIDESASVSAGPSPLHFATLADWKYDPNTASPCPPSIRPLNGREVNCVGFMYPLTAGPMVKSFCLLRSTQTCCYGPRPQYNQYILVESKEPVKFERLAPVMVSGRFWVDPQPDQGYIYRMDEASVQRIGDEAPEVNAVEAARKAHLPLFSFSLLAGIKPTDSAPAPLPAALLALDGKQVVVEGFCVKRLPGQVPGLLIGQNRWDGVSQSKRPSLYNAMFVYPKDAAQVPPLWQQHGVFTGVLKITRDSSLWQRDGIVSLHSARTGISGNVKMVLDPGPLLPISDEALIFVLFLFYTIRWKRKGAIPRPSGQQRDKQ
jgi:hypothetical protein